MTKKTELLIQLRDLKAQREQHIKDMDNMKTVGLSNDQGYTQYDVMGDYLDDIESMISDIEKQLSI